MHVLVYLMVLFALAYLAGAGAAVGRASIGAQSRRQRAEGAIYNRMPVVIEAADWPVRLGKGEGDPATLLRPAAEDVLRFWPISPRVNATRNNDARERRRVPAPGG